MATPRNWPEPVERVAEVLRRSGAEARIEEFPQGTPTAEAAAQAAGCALGQIVKSLVFEAGGRFIVAMIPGDRRADRAKVAQAAGTRKARVASAPPPADAGAPVDRSRIRAPPGSRLPA
jgi:prolyl-tRNA editing enzyme YbaK/EbsC (Cys-tRNA(Pro) deacylase)